MSFTNQMASLRTSLNDTKKRTATSVRDIKSDTQGIIDDAQALMKSVAQTQKANAQVLHAELKRATQNLTRDVREMRGDNIESRKALISDLTSARRSFWGKQKPGEKKKEKEEEKS